MTHTPSNPLHIAFFPDLMNEGEDLNYQTWTVIGHVDPNAVNYRNTIAPLVDKFFATRPSGWDHYDQPDFGHEEFLDYWKSLGYETFPDGNLCWAAES